jgi:hypothetical protein
MATNIFTSKRTIWNPSNDYDGDGCTELCSCPNPNNHLECKLLTNLRTHSRTYCNIINFVVGHTHGNPDILTVRIRDRSNICNSICNSIGIIISNISTIIYTVLHAIAHSDAVFYILLHAVTNNNCDAIHHTVLYARTNADTVLDAVIYTIANGYGRTTWNRYAYSSAEPCSNTFGYIADAGAIANNRVAIGSTDSIADPNGNTLAKRASFTHRTRAGTRIFFAFTDTYDRSFGNVVGASLFTITA